MRYLTLVALCVALTSAVAAQAPAQVPATARTQQPQPAPPAAPAPRAQPPATAKPAAPAPAQAAAPPATPAAPDPLRNEPISIRYEVTIRDQGGPQSVTKMIALTGTLYEISLVRASADPRSPLNVDVNPTALNGSKVRTKIGIEYTDNTTAGPGPGETSRFNVRQASHVWLESGKPIVVSESADPSSDRRLTVEVVATIMR